jgi:hypothetical protein
VVGLSARSRVDYALGYFRRWRLRRCMVTVQAAWDSVNVAAMCPYRSWRHSSPTIRDRSRHGPPLTSKARSREWLDLMLGKWPGNAEAKCWTRGGCRGTRSHWTERVWPGKAITINHRRCDAPAAARLENNVDVALRAVHKGVARHKKRTPQGPLWLAGGDIHEKLASPERAGRRPWPAR